MTEIVVSQDVALALLLLGVLGSVVLAVITFVRSGNVELALSELVDDLIANEELQDTLSERFAQLPTAHRELIISLVDVLDPLTDFTATDLDNRAVEQLQDILNASIGEVPPLPAPPVVTQKQQG